MRTVDAAVKPRRMGLNASRALLNAVVYTLLVLAILVMRFPIAWMLSISFRPNVEVMKIPPDWLPQVFTLEGYKKFFSNPRYLGVYFNTFLISAIVPILSLFL